MAGFEQEYEISVMKMLQEGQGAETYTESINKVCTVKNTAELAYVLKHLKEIDQLEPCNINIFKKGIPAVWEHPDNSSGCSWTIQFKLQNFNIVLEYLIVYMCLVKFKRIECNGVKLNVRGKFVRVEIWSKNVPTALDGQEILNELRTSLGLSPSADFIFKSHEELINRRVRPQVASQSK